MATKGFFTSSLLRQWKRDERRAARDRVVVAAACCMGRPDAPVVTFEDAPRERQREAEAAALLLEWRAGACVCILYVPVFRHHDDGRHPSVDRFPAPFDHHGGGSGFLT